jgi:hypothetical protein
MRGKLHQYFPLYQRCARDSDTPRRWWMAPKASHCLPLPVSPLLFSLLLLFPLLFLSPFNLFISSTRLLSHLSSGCKRHRSDLLSKSLTSLRETKTLHFYALKKDATSGCLQKGRGPCPICSPLPPVIELSRPLFLPQQQSSFHPRIS